MVEAHLGLVPAHRLAGAFRVFGGNCFDDGVMRRQHILAGVKIKGDRLDIIAEQIAQRVKELSRDVFQVGESSLYPALQRLTLNGYVKTEWGVSDNNRRARYYTLTPAGRKQLAVEEREFERVVTAIRLVLELA